MSRPILLAVAHGSTHPAAAPTVAALAGQVRRLAPVLDIRVAFVQHAEPSLVQALADADQAGKDVVIVPLLLSTGHHLRADIGPGSRSSHRPATAVTGPLGPDQLLTTALVSRLAETGVPAGTPVVLAADGSADPAAAGQVRDQAVLLATELGVEVEVAFAASGRPAVPTAVARLRSRTGRPVAVATYLLAPGQFHDRLTGSGADWVTAPLGEHPAIAALIIDRYRAA